MFSARQRVITLTPLEAFRIYGFRPKQTLDWNAVASNSNLDFEKLIEYGISSDRLRTMQPSLASWVSARKIKHQMLGEFEDWALNIPKEVQMLNLMDCVEIATHASTQRMLQLGLDYTTLTEKYDMQVENMHIFRYTFSQWTELGFNFIDHSHIIDEQAFYAIFGITRQQGYFLFKQMLTKTVC